MVLGITPLLSVFRNLVGIFELCVLFLLLDRPRFSWKKTVLAYGVFLMVHTLIGTAWVLLDSASYGMLCMVLFFPQAILFFIIMSKDRLSQVIYNTSLQVFILLFGVYICVKGAQLLFAGNAWGDLALRVIYFAFVVWAYLHWLRDPYRQLADNLGTNWVPISLLSLAGNLFVTYCGMYPVHVMIKEPREQIIFVCIFGLLFITHIIMLRMLTLMQQDLAVREEARFEAINNSLLKRELTMIQESVREAKRIRHDTRHHNLVIAEYARKGDLKELLDYLDEQEQEEERNRPSTICENLAVDSILTVYSSKAKQNGIDIKMDVSVEQNIGIRDVDFTSILGNVLENAIHGCVSSGKETPSIWLSIRRKSSKLAIMVRNTCAENILFKGGLPVSEERKGLGIVSILQSVANYDGEADFQSKDGIFTCRILLKIPSEIETKPI